MSDNRNKYRDSRHNTRSARYEKELRIKKKRKRRWIFLGCEIVILCFLIGALYVANKWNQITHEEIFEEEIHVNEDITEETHEVLSGYITLALLGVDNRVYGNYDSGNSDTLIVMNINNDTKEIKMMSVYRDTYLNVFDNSYQKCNSAYANRGPLGTINMLNNNLDLNITDYVSVDFKALADAIDVVGGIDVDVKENEMREMNKFIQETVGWLGRPAENIKEPGLQHLDGIQALTYARIRKIDGGDFGRAERQRTVVNKLIEKARDCDIGQLNSLLDAVFPEISTSLSFAECIGLITNVQNYTLGESRGFPFDMRTADLGKKGDCVVPCDLVTNVSKAHEFLYGVEGYVPTNAVTQISQKIVADTGYTAESAVDYGY